MTLAELRKKKGLTQIELAERVGTAQTRVSEWELGQYKPGFYNIRRLAEALGVSASEIVDALA